MHNNAFQYNAFLQHISHQTKSSSNQVLLSNGCNDCVATMIGDCMTNLSSLEQNL
jgi:hypothetical protein